MADPLPAGACPPAPPGLGLPSLAVGQACHQPLGSQWTLVLRRCGCGCCVLGGGVRCRPPADKRARRSNAPGSPRSRAGAGARDGCSGGAVLWGVRRLGDPRLSPAPSVVGVPRFLTERHGQVRSIPTQPGPRPFPGLPARAGRRGGQRQGRLPELHRKDPLGAHALVPVPRLHPRLCWAPLDPRPALTPPSTRPGPWDAQGRPCEAGPGRGGQRGAGRAWLTLRLAVRPAPGPCLRHLQAHAHAADGGLRQGEGTAGSWPQLRGGGEGPPWPAARGRADLSLPGPARPVRQLLLQENDGHGGRGHAGRAGRRVGPGRGLPQLLPRLPDGRGHPQGPPRQGCAPAPRGGRGGAAPPQQAPPPARLSSPSQTGSTSSGSCTTWGRSWLWRGSRR